MAHHISTTDIRGKMILMGTGTSVGVPVIGCPCPVCQSSTPQNQRLRCSAVVGLPEGVLLIDTPPDLRTQLLRTKLGVVHAVAFTHEHADHLYGMDELRLFQFYLNSSVPIYCEEVVENRIRTVFDYAFATHDQTHAGAAPRIEFHRISTEPFNVLGAQVIPIRLHHGPRFKVLGFRFGKIAYCTDTNEIPVESWERLKGLDILILDALRPRPHATHFSLEQAVEVAERLQPKRTYFTHVGHELDYHETNQALPPNMELAYDGLTLSLNDD